MTLALLSQAAACGAALCGCGTGTAAAVGADAAVQSAGDGYEAFPPDFPSIVAGAGPRLTSPKLVTITWASDVAGATMQDFDERLGASAYWKATTSEYGIGEASSQSVVIQSAPPAAWDDTQVDKWVQAQAQSSSSGWPPPDGQTVYVVYLPASVELASMGQDACLSYAGYHTDLGTSPDIAYALIPEACYRGTPYSLIDNATSSAAHEIVEAVTDPFSNLSPAYLGFDPDHLAWELWTEWQDEVADACEFSSSAYYREGADLPYLVQRIWSNESAYAGHDPCVPRLAVPYFDVAPQALESLSIDALSADGKTVSPFTSKGFRIAPGQTATVKVGFFSDAPSGAWSVTLAEGDCCTKAAGLLTLSPTTLTGRNGDVGAVSVTVNKAPAVGNAIAMSLTSSNSSAAHVRPVLIGAY